MSVAVWLACLSAFAVDAQEGVKGEQPQGLQEEHHHAQHSWLRHETMDLGDEEAAYKTLLASPSIRNRRVIEASTTHRGEARKLKSKSSKGSSCGSSSKSSKSDSSCDEISLANLIQPIALSPTVPTQVPAPTPGTPAPTRSGGAVGTPPPQDGGGGPSPAPRTFPPTGPPQDGGSTAPPQGPVATSPPVDGGSTRVGDLVDLPNGFLCPPAPEFMTRNTSPSEAFDGQYPEYIPKHDNDPQNVHCSIRLTDDTLPSLFSSSAMRQLSMPPENTNMEFGMEVGE